MRQDCVGATKHAFETLIESISDQIRDIELGLTVEPIITDTHIEKDEKFVS